MDVTKSHAEIQRAYRLRLKQQHPELLRMREREKWRRQCLKKISQHKNAESDSCTQSQNMALVRRSSRNYNNGNMPRHVVSENKDINEVNAELSVKYPIHDLLRWLDNVEVNDNVKYGFLKYIYCEKSTTIESPSTYNNGSMDAYKSFVQQNTGAAEDKRQDVQKWRDTPNQIHLHYVNDRKRIPVESLSESSESNMILPKDTHHENAERRVMPLRLKSAKKMRKKVMSKKTRTRKKMDVKQREHITWEPLCFDIDDTDETDERSAYKNDA